MGLEGFIYESGMAKHTAQFTETTEKLCNYMQANYKSGADITGALRQLNELTIQMPSGPTGTTDASGNYLPPSAAEEHIFKQSWMQNTPMNRDTKKTRRRHSRCYMSIARLS